MTTLFIEFKCHKTAKKERSASQSTFTYLHCPFHYHLRSKVCVYWKRIRQKELRAEGKV